MRTLTRAGLSTAEARGLLEIDGPNRVPAPPAEALWPRVGRNLRLPRVVLSAGAALMAALLGDLTTLIAVGLTCALAIAATIARDHVVRRIFRRLAARTEPVARVLRDGLERTVPAAGVVRGDVVLLGVGDIVPADLVLDDTDGLRCAGTPRNPAAGDEVLAGAVIAAGRGAGVVSRTGRATVAGRRALEAPPAAEPRTPLEWRLGGYGRELGGVVLVVVMVTALSRLIAGAPLTETLLLALTLGIAAAPVALPGTARLADALAARTLASEHGVLATRPGAVEALGEIRAVITADVPGKTRRVAKHRARGRSVAVVGVDVGDLAAMRRGDVGVSVVRDGGAGDPVVHKRPVVHSNGSSHSTPAPEPRLPSKVGGGREAPGAVRVRGAEPTEGRPEVLGPLRVDPVHVHEAPRRAASVLLPATGGDPARGADPTAAVTAAVTTALTTGRRLHADVRAQVHRLLTASAAALAVMLAGPVVGVPDPLSPAQLVWLGLLVRLVPPGVGPGLPTAFGAEFARSVAWAAALVSTASLAAAVWAGYADLSPQAAAFTVLILGLLPITIGPARPQPEGLRLASRAYHHHGAV